MFIVFSISVIIVAIVIILAVLTTSKAYTYKHTIDPIEHNHQNLNDAQTEHEQ